MKRQRIPNVHGGSDYRIGDYVAIKEDERFHGQPEEHGGSESSYEVTWGAVPAAYYDRMDGDVGIPDAVFEAGTLTKLQALIENAMKDA